MGSHDAFYAPKKKSQWAERAPSSLVALAGRGAGGKVSHLKSHHDVYFRMNIAQPFMKSR